MNDEDQINLPILILCGGKGTRFKSTKLNTSKNIAPIGDSFFLDLIIDFYERQGFTNFILCLGYLSKEIISHVNKRLLNHNIKFSIENEPLGTGGAVYNACRTYKLNKFIVINGDSFCNFDLLNMVNYHFKNNSSLTIAVSKNDGRNDAGNISIADNKIKNFSEKKGESIYINAGVYVFDSIIFKYVKSKKFSLEYDLIPNLISLDNIVFPFLTNASIFDIGTPERYLKVKNSFNNIFN